MLCVMLQKQKRGSFLARSKESLAKIAEMTKPLVNPSAGAKSSGKFTFNVISQEKSEEGVRNLVLEHECWLHLCYQK